MVDPSAEATLHPLLRAVVTALDGAGVPWRLIRGEAEPRQGQDFDLVVARSRIPQLKPVLEELRFGQTPLASRGTYSSFVTYDAATDKWIKLDIVIDMVCREHETQRASVARVFGRIVRKLMRPGFAVALVAPDGAGKTTLAKGLARSFYPAFPARYVYMGFGRSQQGLINYSIPGASTVITAVRYVVALVHIAFGRIVIFDRYFYDVIVPVCWRLTIRERIHRWLFSHVNLTPDAVIILDAPGDVLHARRPEHSVEELERRRQDYLDLVDQMPRPIVVDASQDPEQVRREALAEIWSLYARRLSAGAPS